MNTSTSPASVTIKPHPREVVREFLEACKNYGSAKFYNDVVEELKAQVPITNNTQVRPPIVHTRTLINPNRSN